MLGNRSRPRIPLPRQWPERVRSGVLHAISLAHFSATFTRSWAANGFNARIRLKAENAFDGPRRARDHALLGRSISLVGFSTREDSREILGKFINRGPPSTSSV
jgi:hypothetical protein